MHNIPIFLCQVLCQLCTPDHCIYSLVSINEGKIFDRITNEGKIFDRITNEGKIFDRITISRNLVMSECGDCIFGCSDVEEVNRLSLEHNSFCV